jgi:hypothetical protein
MKLNLRKLAWNKLNCSFDDLLDLLNEVYDEGIKEGIERSKQSSLNTELSARLFKAEDSNDEDLF